MKVLVGGASGFLGSALVVALRESGHQVTRLVRRESRHDDESTWDPAAGRIDQVVVARNDVVINLSGATIARWPRTKSYQRTLLSSRVDSTRTLAKAIARAEDPPRLLSGSASGFYGQDRGETVLTETTASGDGFLADLVVQWEAAAAEAQDAGAGVTFLRTSLVVDGDGGLLKPLLPVFRLGLGARLGSGRQFMPLISRADWVRAVLFLIEHPEITGPVNLVAPDDITNAQFTDTLGEVLGRPTFLVAPGPALKLGLGALAGDLLGSVRMEPAVLQGAGFSFEHPSARAQIEAGIH